MPLVLRELADSDEPSFRKAVEEFRVSDPEWAFAFFFDGATDFPAYVRRLCAWTRGIDRLLLTCDDDNVGSWKVIESCGGVLENTVEAPGQAVRKRRYWISLGTTRP